MNDLIPYKIIFLYKMRITMPAKAPAIDTVLGSELKAMGARIRAHRKQQKLSATVTAEAAGMSRVTLHRIERGEPSVTMGAYLSSIAAIGLQIDLSDPRAERQIPQAQATSLPPRLRLQDYPQLKRLAWQMPGVAELTPAEALSLYERNWRHVDPASLEPSERALIQSLAKQIGGGRLLV